MRKAIEKQGRLDGGSVSRVQLNLNCRDELIPILRGLQEVYSTPTQRDQILKLVKRHVSAESRSDRGREGLSDWCILVLAAAARLGCNLDYDKLQDLAGNHRGLRGILQVGEFDETNFSCKRIRDNVCLLQPETIGEINQKIVIQEHTLVPDAVQTMRADSFVVETNIHYPTDPPRRTDRGRHPQDRGVEASARTVETAHVRNRLASQKRSAQRVGDATVDKAD